jgi:tRNA/rRNA methyltransferase
MVSFMDSYTSHSWLNRVTIILCRPEGQVNIGSVCRAMKTMGITRLKLVNPSPENLVDIKTWSLSAFDLYEQAQQFASLNDAIKNAVLVAGTSRRIGKNRKFFALSPAELATKATSYADGEIAIVFGNEKNGLNDEELKLCHLLVSIPSSADFASLNLAQAVQIVTYELFQAQAQPQLFHPIGAMQISRLVTEITNHLEALGFFNIAQVHGYTHVHSFLTNVLGRTGLNEGEAAFLAEMFSRLHHIKQSSPQTDKNTPPFT